MARLIGCIVKKTIVSEVFSKRSIYSIILLDVIKCNYVCSYIDPGRSARCNR